MSADSNQPAPLADLLIISHAILSGAAIFVPIAFVDDFLVSVIRQNQARALAGQYRVNLSAQEVKLLANIDSDGCWQGLLGVLKYPFKIVRQFLKILEVKKSVETATDTYYTGLLFNEVLRNGWYTGENFNRVQQAIHETKRDINKELVSGIFRSYLVLNRENLTILSGWGRELLDYLLASSRAQVHGLFRRVRLVRQAVEEHPEALFERQPPQVGELARQIYENLNANLLGKPQQQHQELLARLAAALKE